MGVMNIYIRIQQKRRTYFSFVNFSSNLYWLNFLHFVSTGVYLSPNRSLPYLEAMQLFTLQAFLVRSLQLVSVLIKQSTSSLDSFIEQPNSKQY